MPLKARAAAKTDVGLVRRSNQDSFGIDTDTHVYVVCDGMGGAAGGEVASSLAVQTFLATARQELVSTTALNGQRNTECLRRAAHAANRAVRLRALYEPRFRGMGTTLVAARIDGEQLAVVNVGDSRAYLVRDGRARQLTLDHSYVAESVRRGLMTVQQAERSSMQSVITRAIGAQDDVDPEIFSEALQAGDTLLLCSDGLTRHVSSEDIAAVLSVPGQSAIESCRQLIGCANQRGGLDNITCLAVQMCEETAPQRGRLTLLQLR